MKGSKCTFVVAISTAVIVGLLVGGCGPAATPAPTVAPGATEAPTSRPAAPTPTSPPEAKKVVRIASAVGCNAMSLSAAGGMGPCEIQMAQMFESLVFRDHDGNVVPQLATSWELVEPTVWQFDLRQGVKFHNGEDFNAESVKFSFEVALDPERAWPIGSNITLIDNVEIVDDYTVNLHTSLQWPDLPFFIGDVYMMPPEYTQEVGDDGLIANPVGTGPFTFVEFVPNDYTKFEAFDDYWRGRVKVDEIFWRLIPEPATRVAALQAGEVDIAVQVPLDLIPVVEEEPGMHMDYAAEQLTLQFMLDCLPCTETPLLDVRLRKALDYGIDKEAIWEGFMGGLAPLSGQQLTPGVFGYNPNIEQTPYDPDRAKELLAEAGYPNGLTVKMITPVGKYFVDRDAAVAAKSQLAEIGVDVDLTIAELALWYEALDHPCDRYDMIYVGWYSYGNPAQAMQWYSKIHPWHRWENDEYDDLFLVAKTSLDEEERRNAYYRMAEIMAEETPGIFIMQQPAPYGISDKLTGFQPHPIQYIVLTDADLVE